MNGFNPLATMTHAYLDGLSRANMIWAAQTRAMVEAVRTGANVSVGDITIYFPFGQGFSQDIDPRTNWGWMTGSATVWPEIEEQIVRRAASYGVQLDKVMAVLLDLADRVPEADAEKVAELKALAGRIEQIKRDHGRT